MLINMKLEISRCNRILHTPCDLENKVNQFQHSPFYTNLTFACKTETLGSLYSHALLIPLKSSKSKYQMVHEQKFKDLLSSKCPVGVERIVLDLESEAMRGPGSIPTGGGNIFF